MSFFSTTSLWLERTDHLRSIITKILEVGNTFRDRFGTRSFFVLHVLDRDRDIPRLADFTPATSIRGKERE